MLMFGAVMNRLKNSERQRLETAKNNYGNDFIIATKKAELSMMHDPKESISSIV